MSALEPGRQLLSAVLRALSEAEREGRLSARITSNRKKWVTENADADGVVVVPEGWATMDPPGTWAGDEPAPSDASSGPPVALPTGPHPMGATTANVLRVLGWMVVALPLLSVLVLPAALMAMVTNPVVIAAYVSTIALGTLLIGAGSVIDLLRVIAGRGRP